MKVSPLLVGLLLLISAAAQQSDTQSAKGVIYGIVIGSDGKPVKEVGLTSSPVGVPLATRLPFTRTDQSGRYRFERLDWWGKYTVYADDDDAGYSIFSTGLGSGQEVTLSAEHPEAEFNFRLPPPAGFLQIHLTNRKTGTVIPGLEVKLMLMDHPDRPIFMGSSDSNRPILITPDKDLLLHVTSLGFHEWDDSAGAGKRIRLASGSHLALEVKLEPFE